MTEKHADLLQYSENEDFTFETNKLVNSNSSIIIKYDLSDYSIIISNEVRNTEINRKISSVPYLSYLYLVKYFRSKKSNTRETKFDITIDDFYNYITDKLKVNTCWPNKQYTPLEYLEMMVHFDSRKDREIIYKNIAEPPHLRK